MLRKGLRLIITTTPEPLRCDSEGSMGLGTFTPLIGIGLLIHFCKGKERG
jgi:hypothetical protein